MLRLCAGSGAQEIELLGPVLPSSVWARTREKVIRLLTQRGQAQAADHLGRLPFELWNGTNGFGDEFVLLYAELPMDQYVEIADLEDDATQRSLFHQIERALAEADMYVRFIAASLGDEDAEPAVVAAPSLAISSDVVERALADVERTLADGRPAEGIDRIHTALHAYLRELARSGEITVASRAAMPELLKALRQEHPALRPTGPRAGDVTRILYAMATIVDSMNPVRNSASLAHPAEVLLLDAEAMLVINAVRTMLHYLEQRMRNARAPDAL